MAKKIEIIENALIVTDTISTKIEISEPAKDYWYKESDLQIGRIILYDANGLKGEEQITKPIINLSNAVDSDDVAFTESTFRDFCLQNLGKSNGGSASITTVTGWGSYSDTQYTDVSPLSVTGGASYVDMPNNAGSKIEAQKPTDIDTFYDESTKVITGRFGDGINITLSFAVKPTTNQVTRVTVVPDIGGAVGEIEDYTRDVSFSRGQNIVQRYLSSFDAYTYDTWENNGATLKIKADQDCEIHSIRYMITRTHKAR